MTQFGCAQACSGVTSRKVAGSRVRNGPPDAVIKGILESEYTRIPLWREKPESELPKSLAFRFTYTKKPRRVLIGLIWPMCGAVDSKPFGTKSSFILTANLISAPGKFIQPPEQWLSARGIR